MPGKKSWSKYMGSDTEESEPENEYVDRTNAFDDLESETGSYTE
jgi:hypothetical protein